MTTDGPDEAEARGQWREVADTQQIALECFANMCVPFGAEDWAEAAADGDPNDGGYLEDDGAGGDGPGVALPPEIVEALQPIPLLGLVTARMELLSDGIHQVVCFGVKEGVCVRVCVCVCVCCCWVFREREDKLRTISQGNSPVLSWSPATGMITSRANCCAMSSSARCSSDRSKSRAARGVAEMARA